MAHVEYIISKKDACKSQNEKKDVDNLAKSDKMRLMKISAMCYPFADNLRRFS